MAEVSIQHHDFFNKWKSNNISEDSILNELLQSGFEESQASEILKEYKKKCCDERQTQGFILTGIGAFLGFLSCVFTMLDLIPEMRGVMLYGLTSAGLLVVFAGLYLIFE